jgi:hypothetical protein
MSAELPPQAPVTPITSLDDPRAIQLLATEHWSLLSARSLAYNEAFVRAGMFLTFLSMSFVALALLAQAMSFGRDFLVIAALLITFDFIIGLTTFVRIGGANADDLRAVHGMARIRHAYTQISPLVTPYFTAPIHDDIDAVVAAYGGAASSMSREIIYGLTTSAGMIGLIVSLVGGVLASVLSLLFGVEGGATVWIGAGATMITIASLIAYALATVPKEQAALTVLFPTPRPPAAADSES